MPAKRALIVWAFPDRPCLGLLLRSCLQPRIKCNVNAVHCCCCSSSSCCSQLFISVMSSLSLSLALMSWPVAGSRMLLLMALPLNPLCSASWSCRHQAWRGRCHSLGNGYCVCFLHNDYEMPLNTKKWQPSQTDAKWLSCLLSHAAYEQCACKYVSLSRLFNSNLWQLLIASLIELNSRPAGKNWFRFRKGWWNNRFWKEMHPHKPKWSLGCTPECIKYELQVYWSSELSLWWFLLIKMLSSS